MGNCTGFMTAHKDYTIKTELSRFKNVGIGHNFYSINTIPRQ